jgi:heme exporter protein D
MKYAAYLWGAVAICIVLIAVLFWQLDGLNGRVRTVEASNDTLQKSLTRMQADVKAQKELAPGLGDYMTTIQLHAGKLWFAARASNWKLAEYEINELKETMEAARALNAEKNGVKISNVLHAVLQTEVAQLAESVKRKNQAEFLKSYDDTLSACNGCHFEAGYEFIHIVRPSAPPVTNQRWEAAESAAP